MEIYISNTGDVPICSQITDQIKKKIMSGELKEGDTLPASDSGKGTAHQCYYDKEI